MKLLGRKKDQDEDLDEQTAASGGSDVAGAADAASREPRRTGRRVAHPKRSEARRNARKGPSHPHR
ncbi:hypothetical protein L841_1494 [Mycobacterium sp. MAC_080597_8934]|nr:hypothetical protein L841_1494 [Mycobacterium sp. MAC_080597_8934]